VALDAGNFFDLPTDKGTLQTKILVEAMDRLSYDVVNVGERDVRLGYDNLQKFVGEADFRIVSANFVRAADRSPIFDQHAVVEVPRAAGKPLRIGVTGAVRFNSLFKEPGPAGSEMVIVHPTEAVRAQVEKLRGKNVDVVVLLAAMPIEDASRIAADVPGIDFVFGAFGARVTPNAERVGTTELLYLDNRGQRMGETRVFLGEDRSVSSETTLHQLSRLYPEDRAMAEFVGSKLGEARAAAAAEAAAKLGAAGKPAAPPSVAAPPAPTGPFVGTGECRRCHAGEHAQWEATAHAHALDTLRAQSKDGDAGCVSCHVTGWQAPGGFVSADATPALAAVGCESCHGPGRIHVANLAARYGAIDVATCTRCHDRTNDPDFDYYALLPRVSHGDRHAAAGTP
jgi:hypothetical protein